MKSTPIYSIQANLSKHTTPINTFSAAAPHLTPLHTFKPQFSSNENVHRKRVSMNTNTTSKAWMSFQIGSMRLDQSIDIITEKAASLFYNSEYKKAINVLDE